LLVSKPEHEHSKEHKMSTTTIFNVTGMTCGHCVAAVTAEVSKLDNVTEVVVDLVTGSVTVESDGPVDTAAFAAAVDEAGYEVAS
jgi:copper chaperone